MSMKTFLRQLTLERCRYSVSQLRALSFMLRDSEPEDIESARQSIDDLVAILDSGLTDLEGAYHEVTNPGAADFRGKAIQECDALAN